MEYSKRVKTVDPNIKSVYYRKVAEKAKPKAFEITRALRDAKTLEFDCTFHIENTNKNYRVQANYLAETLQQLVVDLIKASNTPAEDPDSKIKYLKMADLDMAIVYDRMDFLTKKRQLPKKWGCNMCESLYHLRNQILDWCNTLQQEEN